MASIEEVDAVLAELLARLDASDGNTQALFPDPRTIEARCPDLELVRHAEWRDGQVRLLDHPPEPGQRADIRVTVRSDDLLRIVRGELSFGNAYLAGRLRLEASMADLLRLRAAL